MKKTIASLAAVASVGLFAGALTLITPQAAEAGGVCYEASITNQMNTDIAGGASLNEAWQWAVQDGIATDSRRCRTRVVGYARRYASIKPYLWNALRGR